MYKLNSTAEAASELRTKIIKHMNKHLLKDGAEEIKSSVSSNSIRLKVETSNEKKIEEEKKNVNNANSVFSGLFSGFKSYFS